PSAVSRGVARLLAGKRIDAVDLVPLSDDEAADLVAQAMNRPAGAPLVERVVTMAEGNPFAAIELTRCADTGSRLPESTREAIAERLCEVDEAAMPLLERLALIGSAFD